MSREFPVRAVPPKRSIQPGFRGFTGVAPMTREACARQHERTHYRSPRPRRAPPSIASHLLPHEGGSGPPWPSGKVLPALANEQEHRVPQAAQLSRRGAGHCSDPHYSTRRRCSTGSPAHSRRTSRALPAGSSDSVWLPAIQDTVGPVSSNGDHDTRSRYAPWACSVVRSLTHPE